MSRSELNERELSEFSDDLARRARVTAPAALRTQLRASLLAAPVSPPCQTSLWSRLGALRPALAAVLVVALLAAGGGSAAASSLPGDPAFALKRAVEDVQVALAPDDATRLDTLVAQSDRRLADLQTAAAVRATAITPATDEYLAAVARMDGALGTVLTEPATPARDAAIGRATAASAEHIEMLQTLAARLPAAAQRGIQRAIDAQQAVHGRSGNTPGRPASPGNGNGGAPGRPFDLPVPSGRGGPPSGVPGRP
jgi:hypothetical protein